MKGNKVRYTCPLGHILIARIDEDEGYPPESINCMGFRCKEIATYGPAVNVDLPTMVLRSPTNTEFYFLDSTAKEHVNQGGILLFGIGVYLNEIMFTAKEGDFWQALKEYMPAVDEEDLKQRLSLERAGQNLIELKTVNGPLTIHSILMPNQDRWDAFNGWSYAKIEPKEAK